MKQTPEMKALRAKQRLARAELEAKQYQRQHFELCCSLRELLWGTVPNNPIPRQQIREILLVDERAEREMVQELQALRRKHAKARAALRQKKEEAR